MLLLCLSSGPVSFADIGGHEAIVGVPAYHSNCSVWYVACLRTVWWSDLIRSRRTGLFAFEIIDRITAGSLNMSPPWYEPRPAERSLWFICRRDCRWMAGINEYFIGTPGVWFVFNMVRALAAM